MALEWEQGQRPSRLAAALLGAVLGGALGTDCFLAAEQFVGVAAVLCGGIIALWAVTGGELFVGRRTRAGALLALPPVVLWGVLANHLRAALESAPGDPAAVWRAFLSPETVNGPDSGIRYWHPLAGLLGAALAVWIFLFLRAVREERRVRQALQPLRIAFDPPPPDLEVFMPRESWIRPFRLQRRISRGLWLAALFACLWLDALTGHRQVWFRALCGMGFSFLAILSLSGPSGQICAAGSAMYAQRDGTLWRIALNGLVSADLHVRLSWLVPIWEQIPHARRSSVKSAAAVVMEQNRTVGTKLEKLKLEEESPWAWIVTHSGGTKLFIPKVYPRFSPVPGDTEALKEPPPVRWLNPVVTLLITVLCLTIGAGMGLQEEYRAAHQPPEPPPAETVTPAPDETSSITAAITPKVIGDYYLNGLILRTDDEFQASTTELEDRENGLNYRLYLQYGVSEEAAQISLEQTEREQVRYLRPDSGEFLWGMGDNGVTYRYNLRSVDLPHGQTAHTAVARSERGTLLIVECVHAEDTGEELARGTMLYMLENLQFTGPAITEENYQDQLRPAVNMGFNYCGQAFFKAPKGMFEYDAFIDTFMPCGGKVNYYDGGISMMTKAHGLRVSAAVVPSEGTAMDVVEQVYQDLKAAGRQYDEQALFQDAYNEEGNNACRLTVYYDGGRTRVTVLVAVQEREGCYLFKEMTCLPEEVDSEYTAVFKEMEATCGIQVSVMEDLGRHSQ